MNDEGRALTPLEPHKTEQREMTRIEARWQKKQLKKVKKKVNGLKFKEALAKRGYLGPEHIVAKPSTNDQDFISKVGRALNGEEIDGIEVLPAEWSDEKVGAYGNEEIKEEAIEDKEGSLSSEEA